MMIRLSFLILSLIFFSYLGISQTYIPLEVRKAIKNETRTTSGFPGKNYWQNSSDYRIKVSVNPDKNELNGVAEIQYFNNSPDSLTYLVIKLQQDIYRKGAARDRHLSPEVIHDGIEIKRIKVNREKINLESGLGRRGTNLYLYLDKALSGSDSLLLEIHWSSKIPAKNVLRSGRYSQGNYFIAYWYPQIAVYDDMYGWDMTSYTGDQEMYNDFSTYDVFISAPADYMVWATGELQNPADVYPDSVLRLLELVYKADTIMKMASLENGEKSGGRYLEWNYKTGSVTDFAFAFSNNYEWMATTVDINTRKSNKVLINAVFPDNSWNSEKIPAIARKSIRFFNDSFPGVTYPHNSHTTFIGLFGGGMEFPMIANNADVKNPSFLKEVTAHEIAHNYLPFYISTNERLFGWMDESWTTIIADMPFKNDYDYDSIRSANINRLYSMMGGKYSDLPIMTPSVYSGGYAHIIQDYWKAANAMRILLEYFKSKGINNPLKPFIETWKYKRPGPYDFFNFMNNIAGEDLTWFWDPWFFEFSYPDMTIENVDLRATLASVQIRNKGGLPTPVNLEVEYSSGLKEEVRLGLDIWRKRNRSYWYQFQLKESIKSIRIVNKQYPDVDEKNNNWNYE